jgi:membrane protease YdiL (CAAX protease family)
MGISSAITIYALDYLFTAFGVSLSTHQIYAPAWQTLLASLYGGVTEEIIMRLFLMSFFIWLSLKITRSNTPSTTSILFSILLAAVIFGLGHLPITASLTQLNTMVITRAVVLNGVGGIVFGWLYWKKGLESAMIAHFTTDIFLLTLLPQLLR